MPYNAIALTAAEIFLARQSRGLTFSTRRGNWLVCNQAPRLGRITAAQVELLRAQVYPRSPTRNKSVVEPEAKPFQNPVGSFRYTGPYSVELVEGFSREFIPASACIMGNIVSVGDGVVFQGIGAIQFYSRGEGFYFPYDRLKIIRKPDGSPIWVSNNHRSSLLF